MKKWEHTLVSNVDNVFKSNISVSDLLRAEALETRITVSEIFSQIRITKTDWQKLKENDRQKLEEDLMLKK